MCAPCAHKPATSATGQTREPATNTTDLATERPRRHTRCQIGPEGAKSLQKAPSHHTRRQIGPQGSTSAQKAPKHLTRRPQSATENKHRPATAQPHARQGAQAKAEATQPTHESKRANMKQTMKNLTRILRISSGNDTGFMNQIHLASHWQDHVKTIRKYQ